MSEPSQEQNLTPFFNKSGIGQAILRIKDNETLEQAVERLKKDGWQIPELSQLEVKTDATGKYFQIRG